MPAPLRIAAMYRYPVKGLSPQATRRADLVPGGHFPGDRLYALEVVGSAGLPAKRKLLTLKQTEALARIATRFHDADHGLTVKADGEVVQADLRTAEGRAAVEAFIAARVPQAGALRLCAAERAPATDSPLGFVSLVNLTSVAAIEEWVDAPVNPLRFRANLYVEGWPAFAELDLVGRTLLFASGVRLTITERIVRCAATDVDPATGLRDLAIPQALRSRLNHADCGVYCNVLTGGRLDEGERFTLEPPADLA